MENLLIHIYDVSKSEPELKITIPLTAVHLIDHLLPKATRLSLDKKGIVLRGLGELIHKKGPKGVLIEIEQGSEKMIISVQ